jgi:tRNA(His) 5'-end guanylyltransferase
MKSLERRTRQILPRRSYTLLRLDGKAFHTYTRGLPRPFDAQLMADMVTTTEFLCKEVAGCVLAYTQSDEISLLLCDFAQAGTEAYLDGNVQKLTSVTASLATAQFNALRPGKLAFFDARIFTATRDEVIAYFGWRSADAVRNAVSMAARAHFSAKALHGASSRAMLAKLVEAGIVYDDYPKAFRYGTLGRPTQVRGDVTYTHKRTGEIQVAKDVLRRVWQFDAIGPLTPVALSDLVPQPPAVLD